MDKRESYNGLVRAVRWVVRHFSPARQVSDAPMPKPCVLVCRHKNGSGPLSTLLRMEQQARPWVLDLLCQRRACQQHFYHFTLTVRVGLPGWLAAPLSHIVGWTVPPLMRGLGGIPVHRGGMRALITLRESLSALEAGQRIIIYPDVDYADTSPVVKELYGGYLLLARMYEKCRGQALAFVPVRAEKRRIHTGAPIYAMPGESREALGERVRQALAALEQA